MSEAAESKQKHIIDDMPSTSAAARIKKLTMAEEVKEEIVDWSTVYIDPVAVDFILNDLKNTNLAIAEPVKVEITDENTM